MIGPQCLLPERPFSKRAMFPRSLARTNVTLTRPQVLTTLIQSAKFCQSADLISLPGENVDWEGRSRRSVSG